MQNMLDLMHDIMPVYPGNLRGSTAMATKLLVIEVLQVVQFICVVRIFNLKVWTKEFSKATL